MKLFFQMIDLHWEMCVPKYFLYTGTQLYDAVCKNILKENNIFIYLFIFKIYQLETNKKKSTSKEFCLHSKNMHICKILQWQ